MTKAATGSCDGERDLFFSFGYIALTHSSRVIGMQGRPDKCQQRNDRPNRDGFLQIHFVYFGDPSRDRERGLGVRRGGFSHCPVTGSVQVMLALLTPNRHPPIDNHCTRPIITTASLHAIAKLPDYPTIWCRDQCSMPLLHMRDSKDIRPSTVRANHHQLSPAGFSLARTLVANGGGLQCRWKDEQLVCLRHDSAEGATCTHWLAWWSDMHACAGPWRMHANCTGTVNWHSDDRLNQVHLKLVPWTFYFHIHLNNWSIWPVCLLLQLLLPWVVHFAYCFEINHGKARSIGKAWPIFWPGNDILFLVPFFRYDK